MPCHAMPLCPHFPKIPYFFKAWNQHFAIPYFFEQLSRPATMHCIAFYCTVFYIKPHSESPGVNLWAEIIFEQSLLWVLSVFIQDFTLGIVRNLGFSGGNFWEEQHAREGLRVYIMVAVSLVVIELSIKDGALACWSCPLPQATRPTWLLRHSTQNCPR